MTTRGGDPVLASPDGEFLYFAREEGHPDLWRSAVDSGEETLVLAGQQAARGCWDVQSDGVYFVDFLEGERSGNWFIKRIDPDSGAVVQIASTAGGPRPSGCLSVSPMAAGFSTRSLNRRKRISCY